MWTYRHILRLSTIITTIMVFHSQASAQEAEGATQTSTRANNGELTIEEIVVVARKRAEKLKDVPISITVVSADALERRQIDNIAQVGESIPNMVYQPGAPTGTGASTPSVFIRGVGSSETSLGTEPGVGLYVDDVYIARSVGSVLDLIDVESVQVLRGPQGTLFGRNSLGGAIIVRSRQPGDEFGGTIEAKTGSYDRFDLRGSIDLPINNSLRTSFSGLYSSRDGYVKSLDGKANGNINRYAGRGIVKWTPDNSFELTLAGDFSHIDERALPGVLLGLVPNIPFTSIPSSIQAVSNLQAACGGASVLGNSGNVACIDQQYILGPLLSGGGYQTNNEIFDSQGSRPYGNTSLIDIRGVSATMTYNISSAVSVKSITAYRTLDAFWTSNSDHTPNPGIETKNDQNQKQFTQELQLLGDTDRLQWVLGSFYMHEKGDALNVVAFPDVIFRSGGGFSTRSAALFGQATYKLLPPLELTAGLRYTYELKKFSTLSNQEVIGVLIDPVNRVFLDFRDNPIPFVTGATPDIESNELTPHLSLAYHWSSDVMTYVSYSKGYKSGGYEQRLAPGTPEVPSFRPEYLESFETGIKALVPNTGLAVSASVFHSKYRDMQISVVDGPAPTLTNAGDATLNGGELEINWRASQYVVFSAYGSYLDAGYDDVTQRAMNSGITLNSALPNVSKWQFGASIDGTILLGSSFELRPHIDWAYRSGQFVDSSNTSLLYQEGFSLVNAALTLSMDEDRWQISVSGRNLLNKVYLVSGIAQYNIGEIEGQYARPREWTLSMKARF